MTLADFLLARIAEDEAAARAASHDGSGWTDAPAGGWGNGAVETTTHNIVVYDEGRPSPEQGAHIARHGPERVLAECEAKRQIVLNAQDRERGAALGPAVGDVHAEARLVAANLYDDVMRHLAAVYADHPAYRDEWRA